jgi:acyl-CoA thioesterase FadM
MRDEGLSPPPPHNGAGWRGPEAAITRFIEYNDTDASGYWHYTTVLRLAEAAEVELHRGLGTLDDVFLRSPRVHITLNVSGPVRFGDEVVVSLAVSEVGRSSITYRFEIEHEGQGVAYGTMVTVLVDSRRRAVSIPPEVRRRLSVSR